MKVTTIIISKSEKINRQVLDSANFSAEIIIVVDSPRKKSKTVGRIVYFYRPLNQDYASQRNFALSKSHSKWVLFIDDDEYIGTELAEEIKQISPESSFSGYLLRRIDVCFHQPLLHGETGNTKLLRLARKSAGKFTRPVHEKWLVSGKVGELSSPLYHLKNNQVSAFIGRMSFYASIDAMALTKEGKPFSYLRLFLYPPAKFIQNYLLRRGFMDGTTGLISAYLMSVQSLTVRIFQWTKRN